MSNISELRNKLQQGDNKRIAKLSGKTENYVSMVLNEKRKNKKILELAAKIIENRQSFDAALQSEIEK